MPEITLITTSPFPGLEQIVEVTIPSLLSQTCHDFVWMYLDGYHKTNTEFFSSLNLPFKVIHLPLMQDARTAHKFHWEPYNSAAVLVRTPYMLRWGRFRSYHPRAVEESLTHMRNGLTVDFHQTQRPATAVGERYPFADAMRWELREKPTTSCGMIGCNVDFFVDALNGNDEVGMHQNHFEDVEMAGRMKNLPGPGCMHSATDMVRYAHTKSWAAFDSMDVPTAKSCGSPGCPYTAPGFQGRREALVSHGHCQRFDYHGIDFWQCQKCGAFGPGDADEYRDWVHARGATQALTGVCGHGRNLRALRDAVNGLHLESAVEIVQTSYGVARYLS